MKKNLLLLLFLLPYFLFSQSDRSDVHPFRVGLKIGMPDGVAIGIEYVTPLLNNRIAPYADYGMIQASDVDVKYYEIGSNIYFRNTGRGGYVSAAYGNLNAEVSNLSGDTEDGREYTNGVAKEQLGSFNLKLGGKFGKKLYFRIEAGYAIGQLPSEISILADVDGEQEIIIESFDEAFDYISGSGYPLFNLGLGYSF